MRASRGSNADQGGAVPGDIEDRAAIVALGQNLTQQLLKDKAPPGSGPSDAGAEGGAAVDAAGD